ncbi:hypothetical protein [Streptomyces sp. NPDC001389]|uniref:hypothetical protein n=1 Tax=Streptomyces sp. NPDC001389 TaxID=3364569 RepID=UPI0036B09929
MADNSKKHPANPSSCRHCGNPRSEHTYPRSGPMDCHGYEEPTERQILARMLARRAART